MSFANRSRQVNNLNISSIKPLLGYNTILLETLSSDSKGDCCVNSTLWHVRLSVQQNCSRRGQTLEVINPYKERHENKITRLYAINLGHKDRVHIALKYLEPGSAET